MDFPPIFFLFWALCAVVIFFGLRKKWRRRKAWEDAAKTLGLQFSGGWRRDKYQLEGDIDEVYVFVHVEPDDTGMNRRNSFFTVFETTHAQRAMLEERVQHIVRDQDELVDTIERMVEQTRKESKRSAS